MLTLSALHKSYGPVSVFRGVDLQVAAGEFVALLGESGVGKSTLLNCIAGLDDADGGRVTLGGVDVGALDADGRARLRRERLGFVFQAFHVLPHLSVAENVALPLRLLGRSASVRLQRVHSLLDAVGLEGLAERLPAQLSGGQLQRVAIARALVLEPPLVLADEPTGNLDTASSDEVFALMRRMHAQLHTSFLIVTHDPRLAARCDRVLELVDGRLVQGGTAAG